MLWYDRFILAFSETFCEWCKSGSSLCVCVFVWGSSCQAFIMCATAFETNAWARKLKTKVVFVGTSRCVVEHESNLYCIWRNMTTQVTILPELNRWWALIYTGHLQHGCRLEFWLFVWVCWWMMVCDPIECWQEDGEDSSACAELCERPVCMFGTLCERTPKNA